MCLLVSNFRNIFYIDQSEGQGDEAKISIIASSKLSKYDLSFNKIMHVRRLSDTKYAYVDE